MCWHRFLKLVVSLVVLLAGGMGLQAEVLHSLVLGENQISFHEKDGKVSLSQVEVLSQGTKQLWLASEPGIPLWTVVVQDSNGARTGISALDAPAQVQENSKDEIEFTWKGLKPGDVQVVMTVCTRGGDSLWSLEVEAHQEGYGLWDVTFPEIGPIDRLDQVHSISTYGWGVIHKDLMSRNLEEAVYPSCVRAMPFVALSDGKTGLYLGIEDQKGYPLRLFVGKNNQIPAVSLGLRHELEDMGRTRHYKTPYQIVMTPFEGDWYEAGRIYRAAAMKTPWGSVPPLADRKDIPQWVKDLDLWMVTGCHDEATANQIIEFANTFGVPTAAHVYSWHEIPFDDHYPEYFPAKPGFVPAVAKVQAAGIPVMPYINGRLWDSTTTSWQVEDASKACSINEQGKPYVEVYGSKVPLSPMCPSTELWKDKITGLVDRLIHECGVKAVYIDQISAAEAKRCFAANHGHPMGGGTYWIQGYRDLVSRCRAKLGPDNMLTTEENADPWNDLLHAFLLVNTRDNGGEMVPLYPAVYGGRVISFGFQYISGDDYTWRYPLRLKFARALVFGSQLGWVGPEILQPANKTEAEFLKRLCQARHTSRDALQYGELLAPPELEKVGTVSWGEAKDGAQPITQPAVLASLWKTTQGTRKLVVVNVSDEEQKTILTLGEHQLGQLSGDTLHLHPVGEGTDITLPRKDGEVFSGEISLPGCQVIVFEIQGS